MKRLHGPFLPVLLASAFLLLAVYAAERSQLFQNVLKVYTPRQACMLYEQPVIWLHFSSDLLIGLAYLSIPFVLVRLVRARKDLAFSGLFWMFAGFIVACGATHLFGVAALWKPLYRLDGLVKLATAVLSVGTAIALWRLYPRMVALPSLSQALHASEAAWQATFRQFVDGIPQLAWIADRDGWIGWYNRRWYDYTGTTPEEMEGWGWQRVHDPEVLPAVLERWRRSIDTGEAFEMEFPLRGVDGVFRTFLTRVRPIRDERGAVLRWFGTNTDVEEKRQFLEERERLLESERHAREEAERASRLKDEFLATVSHELRTPLNAILGWSQLLRSPQLQEADLLRGLDTIQRNARSQAQIIDDLLDMSRIITGKIRLAVQTVDLHRIVEETLDTVRPAALAKGVRIETTLDPNAGPVKGDPGRLRQIFWNLFSNAIRFTPKEGKMQVVLERVSSHLEVTVSDTGEGIRPDFLPYVFDRFRQQDGSSTRQHGGLGLGLSIVRSLVELHGGSVRAASAGLGQGASFYVNLPISLAELTEQQLGRTSLKTQDPGDPCDPSLEGLKILVVDDDTDNRQILRSVLEACDAEVVEAATAREGLALLLSEKPHVLVSDIGMPEEDGYWLISQVRAIPPDQGGALPAVALTAFARSEDKRRVLRSGFQAHAAKPIEPSDLVILVASLAGRSPGKVQS